MRLRIITAAFVGILAAARPGAAAPPDLSTPIVQGELGEKAHRYLSALEGYGFSGTVLLAKDGKILLHRGYGLCDRERTVPCGTATLYDIGSITKPFTAAAIARLASEGKLAFEDPISKYLPGVPPDKAGITIHHLLTHGSGLDDVFGGDYEEMPRDRLVATALGSKLLWPPGTRYAYSNAGYSLLAAIVEVASGEPWESYLRARLFEPAGMATTGYRRGRYEARDVAHGYADGKDRGTPFEQVWAEDGPWWNLRGNGGLVSTLADLYRFHLALAGDGVLPAEVKARVFSPQLAEDEDGNSHYGYGWSIAKTPRGTTLISHNGGNGIFRADFRRYVDEGVVVLAAGNQAEWSGIQAGVGVVRLTFGMPLVEPPPVVELPASTLSAWAGTYRIADGAEFRVSTAGSSLRLEPAGRSALAALLGAPPADEQARRLEARAVELANASARGDYRPLHEAMGAPMPLEQLENRGRETWSNLRQRFGELKEARPIVTLPDGPGRRTIVELVCERGSGFLSYLWEEGRIAGIRPLDRLPIGDYHPIAPARGGSGELARFQLGEPDVHRIRFESPEGGPLALVVVTAGGDVRATRVP